MPKFAANLTMLYTEFDFLSRFDAAAKDGFAGVEYLFPYPFPPEQLAERLGGSGLVQVLHNLPAGDWDSGERGIACIPGREGEFQAGVGAAIEYAKALDCRQLNCLAGITPKGIGRSKAGDTLVRNLQFAAAELTAADIKLLVEPINTYDIPGFHLSRTSQAVALLKAVGSDNLWLQYDIYHMQRMEGELAATIASHIDRIAHIQIADNPGRHEPGTGEINFDFLFAELNRLEYRGWIGCEYKPASTTSASLGWFRDKTSLQPDQGRALA